MVNLLGTAPGPGWPQGVPDALAVPGATVHLYGKAVSSAGRKMGHVTALGNSLAEAESAAMRAAQALRFETRP
jgi:5-(carboxyamino)imidazole ribonucleotide synthase